MRSPFLSSIEMGTVLWTTQDCQHSLLQALRILPAQMEDP